MLSKKKKGKVVHTITRTSNSPIVTVFSSALTAWRNFSIIMVMNLVLILFQTKS